MKHLREELTASTFLPPQKTLNNYSLTDKVDHTVYCNQTKCQVSNTEINKSKNKILVRSCVGINSKDSQCTQTQVNAGSTRNNSFLKGQYAMTKTVCSHCKPLTLHESRSHHLTGSICCLTHCSL